MLKNWKKIMSIYPVDRQKRLKKRKKHVIVEQLASSPRTESRKIYANSKPQKIIVEY